MAKHLKNILLFLAIFLILNSVINSFWGPKNEPTPTNQGFTVETTETEYSRTGTVAVKLINHTNEAVEIKNDCPGEPFTIIQYINGEWTEKTSTPEISCPEEKSFKIEAGKELSVPYTDWHYALFGDLGRFKIKVNATINNEEKTYESNEFSVVEESVFSMLWMRLFYEPIYNTLIFLISILPGFSLGLAVILLTIILRTILLAPSQKALKSQKKIQELQPKLEEIKRQHAGDQQKIATETMAIWKTHKVNPLSSCLPMLIQLPILIALFYVVQSGLNPDSQHLLYGPLKDFDFKNINIHFLWLDLTKINLYVLPLIVGGLQFVQMKLSTAAGKKKTSGSTAMQNEMQKAMGMMTYFLPVMIAVFTATLPAVVGIYWGTSTTYGILQQIVVNRDKSTTHSKNSDGVKIKVIDKNN